MIKLALIGALLAAPVTYQEKVFTPTENAPGTLSPGELSCVASSMTAFFPNEREIDFLSVRFVREDENRSRACAYYTVERTESVESFVERQTEPKGVYFTGAGTTAVWSERLDAVCLPRGNLNPVVSCLNSYYTVQGQVTKFEVSRDSSALPASLLGVWETVTKQPSEYAADRAAGKAKSHTRE